MDIVVNSISKRFILKNRAVIALDNVKLKFPGGRVTIIYGPSGSGKSVLLNLIAGLDRPDKGSIIIGGRDITKMKWREINVFRRRYITYCMQRNILIPKFKVGLNIALPLLIRGVELDKALEAAYELARGLGIEYTFDRPAYTLSGGEQRRAVLARTLIVEARIVLLDEPTSSLDEDTSNRVREIIIGHYLKYRPTLVIATHDPAFREYGDHLVKLERGRVVEEG